MQSGFMIYAEDWISYTEEYTSEEIGQMLKALLAYFLYGEHTEFTDRGMRQFYRQVVKAVDLDRTRYNEKCESNAYNRYRGLCKEKGATPLNRDDWKKEIYSKNSESTTVDDRQPSSPITIPIVNTNNQQSVFNSQHSIPPTLEEVKEYCEEIESIADPVKFYNYYSEREWKTGNDVMRDWRAVFRVWQSKEKEKPKKQFTTASDYKPPSTIDVDQLARIKQLFPSGQ